MLFGPNISCQSPESPKDTPQRIALSALPSEGGLALSGGSWDRKALDVMMHAGGKEGPQHRPLSRVSLPSLPPGSWQGVLAFLLEGPVD